MDYDGLHWIIMDYNGLQWIIDEHAGLPCITADYEGKRAAMSAHTKTVRLVPFW
jgi:hypothetical protein